MNTRPVVRVIGRVLVTASLAAAMVAATIVVALEAHADKLGPLALRDLEGQRTSLAALRGKVVVLNFWATWCRPCLEEMPVLADLASRYGSRGLVVVAASVDDTADRGAIARVASALPEGMKVWIGATLEDMQRLDLGMAVPVTVILDRKGDIAHRSRGTIAPGSVDATIERLLGAPADEPKKPLGSEEVRDDRSGRGPQAAGRSL